VRFLLVDAILDLEPGRRATGIKNVTMSEDFLADHFPHRPIMPGMLIIESLVQLADWVVRSGSDFECLALASGFDRIKFRRVVRPGDQLRLDVDVLGQESGAARVRGRASCGDVLAVSADLTVSLHPIRDYLDPDEARRQFALLRVEQEVRP
jgi:3-hydroxyacyl-[acyl-carrier-protein] dehydratase